MTTLSTTYLEVPQLNKQYVLAAPTLMALTGGVAGIVFNSNPLLSALVLSVYSLATTLLFSQVNIIIKNEYSKKVYATLDCLTSCTAIAVARHVQLISGPIAVLFTFAAVAVLAARMKILYSAK